MAGSPHYFIAIPVPANLKNILAEWQSDLIHDLSYKQWTHKEDLHITIKFLGAVPHHVIEKLINELRLLKRLSSFVLDLKGIKTFGKPFEPRVLYANVQQTDSLTQLVDLVESCAENCGFQKENRKFRAHVTLAKKWMGEPLNDSIEKRTNNYLNQLHELEVNHVYIYQVNPSKNPKYEIVESYQLMGGDHDGTTY